MLDLTPEQIARRADLAAALLSGEYERTDGTLERHYYDRATERIKAKHCCLGVACREAAKDGVPIETVEVDPILYGAARSAVLYADLLLGVGDDDPQPAVAEYYGITEREQHRLAEMNDGDVSWKDIAGHIERGDLRGD